jgi:hypothetical protein
MALYTSRSQGIDQLDQRQLRAAMRPQVRYEADAQRDVAGAIDER